MKHKKLLTNLLFAAVVLAIAAVLLLVRSAHSSGSKLRAELIYGDNNTTMNLPLDKNDTYDVDTGYYTVHIEIKDGAARFVDSPCPDHICEGFGWLSKAVDHSFSISGRFPAVTASLTKASAPWL